MYKIFYACDVQVLMTSSIRKMFAV